MNRYCQTVVFSDKAYNAIINESFRKDPAETGGILLGHILDNGVWIVMEVLPPGNHSIFEHAYFEYDDQFVNYLAHSVASAYKQELELLGLWHRHPGNMDYFSSTDDVTNASFARLNPQGAMSGIVNLDPDFRLTLYHVSHPAKYDKVEVEVGDKLIPSAYFEWKHFPEKGLNPPVIAMYENQTGTLTSQAGSSKKIITTARQHFSLQKLLQPRYLFGVIALFAFFSAVLFQFSYFSLRATDDIRVPYRLMGLGQLEVSKICQDSIRKEINEKMAALPPPELERMSRLDSLSRDIAISRTCRKLKLKKDDKVHRDSVEAAYDKELIVRAIEDRKEIEINKAIRLLEQQRTTPQNYAKAMQASAYFLFGLTLFSFLLFLFPSPVKWAENWLCVLLSLILALLICFTQPITLYKGGVVYFNTFYISLSLFCIGYGILTYIIYPFFSLPRRN